MSIAHLVRTTLSMVIAGVVVLAATGPAEPHVGNSDPSVIHACVGAGGAVRIVGPLGWCGPGETATHWRGLDAGVIMGRVVTCAGPVQDAFVFIPGRSFNAVTGPSGTYILNDVPVGKYNLTVDSPHSPTVPGVSVAAGRTTSVGDVNVEDLSSDPNHCGACNVVCAAGDACVSGVCTAPAGTCTDKIRNDAETDVDCGGPSCPKCSDGLSCTANTDCTSGVCSGGKCAVPTCSDLARNGPETDVDCGGPTCPKCSDGQGCALNTDCTSGVCSGGRCSVPACNDTVKNGTETDVDCGGACVRCSSGKQCVVNSDCLSNVCLVTNKCQ